MRRVLLIEDSSGLAARSESSCEVRVRLHQIVGADAEVLEETIYRKGSLGKLAGGRAHLALELIDSVRNETGHNSLVVAGSTYGANRTFLRGLSERGLVSAVEIPPSLKVSETVSSSMAHPAALASDLLQNAPWIDHRIRLPCLNRAVSCNVAELGSVHLHTNELMRLFVVDVGSIEGLHKNTIICATSDESTELGSLFQSLYWVRCIRPYVRRRERNGSQDPQRQLPRGRRHRRWLGMQHRPNITIARSQDSSVQQELALPGRGVQGRLFREPTRLKVVELFAGAGGMGLGFLMARGRKSYQLVYSGELNPIYTDTLRQNHRRFSRWRKGETVPECHEPVDLGTGKAIDLVSSIVTNVGGVDVLIGGPPCQGFSNANRNSRSPNNPHNQLVAVFLQYVRRLKPPVFLMENVQGIAWTEKSGKSPHTSVAGHLLETMKRAGYDVYPKLLDAIWYGVPQYRTRLFLLGISRDAGYSASDFGDWGPFPIPTHGNGAQPVVTVGQAIADLPPIANGSSDQRVPYVETGSPSDFLSVMRRRAPRKCILDHITSRHAEYVIERYKRIPPGGNWQDISHMMANYSAIDRTHSNIYRRLSWEEPSITIGHYRKSMIVHPSQDRGLSLREACRLQSFPDWFCISGTADGRPGGLMHKQQQLANAVCPLVARAVAEVISRL